MPVFEPSSSEERGSRRRSPSRSRRSRSRRKSRSRSRSPGPGAGKDGRAGTHESRKGDTAVADPDGNEPTSSVEEALSRRNGDKTWQAVIALKESSGRERLVRGRPRTDKREAEDDAEEMKRAYLSGGAAAVREVQAKQRLQSRG
eukprot:TRINITY_DN25725_c0_g2_i1.p1 TRINITY_DN25725_c0_g2~~TRINITY_DN25725_c0_g2_i1.p1  ORF type:complete len:145 (+),score=25.91 TRINITY_DN25725_c0_g2_i1:35-469(+)